MMTLLEPPEVTTFTMPSPREIRFSRAFSAPPALVFAAFTLPEHPPCWTMDRDDWSMSVCEIDLRPYGPWRRVWLHRDGTEMEIEGEYREVEWGERLVYTERWGPEWPETLNSLVFEQEGCGTRITCSVLYPSSEDRDAALDTRMRASTGEAFDRLESYLTKLCESD